jgi:hypothetical protein
MNTESIVPESIPPTNPSVEIRFYEDWVSREPENIEAFAQLGLAYLFDGELDAAQLTWLGGVAQFSEENLMPATEQLVQILHDKAEEVAVNSDIQISCLIRQYIREIQPENLKNLFFLIRESIALEQFTPELLAEWQVIQILESTEFKLKLVSASSVLLMSGVMYSLRLHVRLTLNRD